MSTSSNRGNTHITTATSGPSRQPAAPRQLRDTRPQRKPLSWPPPEAGALARQMELAGDALLAGWTRDQVVASLVSRIARDEHYLAYRRACHRRTSYDTQVEADVLALALAASWLQAPPSGVRTSAPFTPSTPSATPAEGTRRPDHDAT